METFAILGRLTNRAAILEKQSKEDVYSTKKEVIPLWKIRKVQFTQFGLTSLGLLRIKNAERMYVSWGI